MLELKFWCEDHYHAQHLLNAEHYYRLITDLTAALRSARKHGSPEDVAKVVENFYPDLVHACDHCEGAY